jgi:hypothetical protein
VRVRILNRGYEQDAERHFSYGQVSSHTHVLLLFFSWLNIPRSPTPLLRGSAITLRHITLTRPPLNEWSALRRDLYLTVHTTQKRQISMPPVGFERQSQQASGHRECSHWDRLLMLLFYFILFYFILFYLFCFILFCFVLFYFILFYFISFHFILFYFILFYFILFYFIFVATY